MGFETSEAELTGACLVGLEGKEMWGIAGIIGTIEGFERWEGFGTWLVCGRGGAGTVAEEGVVG